MALPIVPPRRTGDEIARKLAAARHGVVSTRELRAAGLTRHQIEHLRNSPRWERVSNRVLVVVGSPRTDQRRAVTAVLDCGPDAALSYLPAAAAWGLQGCRRRPYEVCRTGSSTSGSDLARIHQVRALPEPWRTELDGLPVVRPELLALQLFAVCAPQRAERLVERLWSMRLLSGASLIRFLDQMGRRGRNGTAGLRAYIDVRGPNYTPPASNLESRVKQILDGAGVHLRAQVDSGSEEHWTGRVDFRHPELPLIVEVQSQTYHRALVDELADARRCADLEAAGHLVVELWDTEVWTRPDVVVARVRAGLELVVSRG